MNELEEQSKKHIYEVNQIHEEYRFYVVKNKELEEQMLVIQQDADYAQENERKLRRDLRRAVLQNETLMKRIWKEKKTTKGGKIIISPKSTT